MKHRILKRYPVGNPRRKWRQDYFILNTACTAPLSSALVPRDPLTHRKGRRGVLTALDAGFNMLGTLWTEPELALDVVRTAEQYGTSVLFQDIKRFGGNWSGIKGETNDYVGAIRDTAKWNCIKGYFLWDEPIFPEHLEETRRMVDYCEEVRPDVLPFTVAHPDYNPVHTWQNGEYIPYIKQFAEVIDPAQMQFDYYPIGKEEYNPALQLDNSTMWSDLEIVRREAQSREIPFWFAYQPHAFPWYPVPCPYYFSMTRAMAFAGVLHGAKGLDCYAEFDGYVDPATGGPGIYFEEQKQLNRELRNLGNTLLALTCLRVIHDETLLKDHPTMVGYRTPFSESQLLTGKLAPRISVSEHTDAYGNLYLMVLNRDYDHAAHISLAFQKPSHVYEVAKDDGEQHFLYENTAKAIRVSLDPGDLRLFRIQDGTEEPFTIEYCLEK